MKFNWDYVIKSMIEIDILKDNFIYVHKQPQKNYNDSKLVLIEIRFACRFVLCVKHYKILFVGKIFCKTPSSVPVRSIVNSNEISHTRTNEGRSIRGNVTVQP